MERFQKFPYGAVSEIPLWSGFRKFPMKRFQNFLCIFFDDHSDQAKVWLGVTNKGSRSPATAQRSAPLKALEI